MTTKKRWDVSKRFLKHSESIFSTSTAHTKTLIQVYLKALKEILPASAVHYFWGARCFQLDKNKLIEPQKTTLDHYPVCLEIFVDSTLKHQLGYSAEKLSPDKLHYLDLITQVYRSKLQEQATQTNLRPPIEVKSPPLQKTASIRAKYRSQKDVILAIEKFAKKQALGSLKSIQDLPELEQEIIHFQNQLFNDLEQTRGELKEEIQNKTELNHFYAYLFDELANRLRITSGLLGLLPSDSAKITADFQPLSIAQTRLKGIIDLCEPLAESLTPPNQSPPNQVTRFTGLEWVHLSLSQLSPSEGVDHCQFRFNHTLNHCKLDGNLKQLASGLSRLFQWFISLQEAKPEPEPEVLRFELTGEQIQSGIELKINVFGLRLTGKNKKLINQPINLWEPAEDGFLSPRLMQQLIAHTFKQQGGTLSLSKKKDGPLECLIRIDP